MGVCVCVVCDLMGGTQTVLCTAMVCGCCTFHVQHCLHSHCEIKAAFSFATFRLPILLVGPHTLPQPHSKHTHQALGGSDECKGGMVWRDGVEGRGTECVQ